MRSRHRIPVSNREAIVAIHHEPEGPAKGGLVFCHGFQSNKSGSYEGRCQRAVAEGYHGVRFDFRGCGESDGRFIDQTLSNKLADLRAVIAYFDLDRLVLFGSSFGGKIAFHAAPDFNDLVAICTRAPVTYNRSFDDRRAEVECKGSVTLETDRSIDKRFFADLDQHPFEEVVDRLGCPVLLVHGAADKSVAIADSFEAAAALKTDVLLEKIQGEGHRFSRDGEKRLKGRLFDFLASVPE